MGCDQKNFLVSVAVPPAPVRVPSQRPLVPSVASVTSVANGKGDNEMTPAAVNRSPGFCLTAEEIPRKPQLGDRMMNGMFAKYVREGNEGKDGVFHQLENLPI